MNVDRPFLQPLILCCFLWLTYKLFPPRHLVVGSPESPCHRQPDAWPGSFMAWDFGYTKFFKHCKIVFRLASCQLSICHKRWKIGRTHRDNDRQRKSRVDGRSDSVCQRCGFLCYNDAVRRFTSSAFVLVLIM